MIALVFGGWKRPDYGQPINVNGPSPMDISQTTTCRGKDGHDKHVYDEYPGDVYQ